MNAIPFDTQKIIDLERQLTHAMMNNDIEVLDQLLHDDLLFVLPTGEVITKRIDMETHKSGNLIFETISSTLDTINLIGENAVVTLSSKIKGKMLTQNFEGNFRYLRIWKRCGDQLKVIAGSCSSM